jgi:hypothetical protein
VPGVIGQFQIDVKINGAQYPIGEGRLRKLSLYETSTYMAPMAEIHLEDRGNVLFEMFPLTGTNLVELRVQDEKEEEEFNSFRIFRAIATRHGSDSHLIKLFLMSEECSKLFTPARFTSYVSKKLSAIAAEIAAELDLETDIEETDSTYTIFCPGWTYAQFLAWMADRARSAQYRTAGYDYFVGFGNRKPVLRFLSQERMKNSDPVVDIIAKDLISDEPYDENDVDQGPYRVYENPTLMGGQGGYGATACYFDFTNSRFVEVPLTVDGSSIGSVAAAGYSHYERIANPGTQFQGLADNISMRKDDVDESNVIMWNGISIGVQNEEWAENTAEATVLRSIGSMVKTEILIRGDLRVQAGKTVNMRIKSPVEDVDTNQTVSGRWVVERVTHQLLPTFVTKILMYRSGVGGSDDKELLVPPGGVIGIQR